MTIPLTIRQLHWVDGDPDPIDAGGTIPGDLYRCIHAVMPIFCVDTVIVHRGRILLQRRARDPQRGRLWIQGGRLKKGESFEAAAVRKAREESGLDVRLVSILGTFSTIFAESEQGGAAHTVNLTFLAAPVEDEPEVRSDADHTEHVWWDLERPIGIEYLDQLIEIARARGEL